MYYSFYKKIHKSREYRTPIITYSFIKQTKDMISTSEEMFLWMHPVSKKIHPETPIATNKAIRGKIKFKASSRREIRYISLHQECSLLNVQFSIFYQQLEQNFCATLSYAFCPTPIHHRWVWQIFLQLWNMLCKWNLIPKICGSPQPHARMVDSRKVQQYPSSSSALYKVKNQSERKNSIQCFNIIQLQYYHNHGASFYFISNNIKLKH